MVSFILNVLGKVLFIERWVLCVLYRRALSRVEKDEKLTSNLLPTFRNESVVDWSSRRTSLYFSSFFVLKLILNVCICNIILLVSISYLVLVFSFVTCFHASYKFMSVAIKLIFMSHIPVDDSEISYYSIFYVFFLHNIGVQWEMLVHILTVRILISQLFLYPIAY